MKKFLVLFLMLMLTITIAGCTKEEEYNAIDEYNKDSIVYEKEDGTLQILIRDTERRVIEVIKATYKKDKLIRVTYTINEENETILDEDSKELSNLDPVSIDTEGLTLIASYEDDTLEERFVNLQKRYVKEYIEELKGIYSDYTFEVTYE